MLVQDCNNSSALAMELLNGLAWETGNSSVLGVIFGFCVMLMIFFIFFCSCDTLNYLLHELGTKYSLLTEEQIKDFTARR